MKEDRFIVGIGQGEHEYTVNGVKYIVDPVFRPFDFKNFKNSLAEVVEKYIKNDLADWTNDEKGGIMSTECVSTAGKED